MKLKITSKYGGESTHVEGEIDGHIVDISGDVSSRGANAKIDGTDYWFYGAYGEEGDPNPKYVGELERKINELYEELWGKCQHHGVDEELSWVATVGDDGAILDIQQIKDEDEDEWDEDE